MNLRELLSEGRKLLVDGAMGTQLENHGTSMAFPGEANLTAPEVVRSIHESYVNAGCQALTTNTFSMNRLYLGVHGKSEQTLHINEVGASLARSVAGSSVYVLGDIGPTGQMLAPFGPCSEDDFYATFREQAEILMRAEVDALLIETMYDLKEALCALHACKDAGTIPVFVSIAFKTAQNGGRTIMGNSVAECSRVLADAGADAIGANCGDLSVESMASIVASFRTASSVPILVQPNAGIPHLVGGKAVFDLGPVPFSQGLLQCEHEGARILGGCCGTTPGHMKKAAGLLFAP